MSQLLPNSLDHVSELVGLWNRCSQPPFLMDERLMVEYLRRPGALVLVEGDPWRAALWGRTGSLGATLDAVFVLPENRLQGLGRALLGRFAHLLGPDVCWRFGGGSHHFVPGLPQSMAEAHGFFSALGLVADWQAWDLLWCAPGSNYQAEEWDETTYRLVRASEIDDLQGLLGHFGRRWQVDTELRCQALRTGSPEQIMGAFHEGALVGFCHIWSPLSRTLGPSTFWLDRSDQAWGGIGPLGVHPQQRGLGLGAGVVKASMAYLRRQGIKRIGVDWTGLPKFYEHCGFQPWIAYRGYHPS